MKIPILPEIVGELAEPIAPGTSRRSFGVTKPQYWTVSSSSPWELIEELAYPNGTISGVHVVVPVSGPLI
jgi:hypothetical protein